MKTIRSFAFGSMMIAVTLGLSACGTMSTADRNTAIGAGVGGVAGNVITGGSTLGTIGGAAAGGVIGRQVK